MQSSKSIAVLIASYNRKEKTLRCLDSLFKQQLPSGYSLKVYLTDDCSSDGTRAAIAERFASVEIIEGTGFLYWAGAMALSWAKAIPSDFYLWLNDDVRLTPDSLAILLRTYEALDCPESIITGSILHPNIKFPHYGGKKLGSRFLFRFDSLPIAEELVRCETMNGNLVLIPDACRKKIGVLNPIYSHGLADYDYGLRATKAGISIWVVPGVQGFCDDNSFHGSYRDTSLDRWARWKLITGPKGLPPKAFWNFVKNHAPSPKVFYWAAPYLKIAFGLRGRAS